jgi:hypothetical protein
MHSAQVKKHFESCALYLQYLHVRPNSSQTLQLTRNQFSIFVVEVKNRLL